MAIQQVAIADIVFDAGTQTRAGVNQTIVAEYAEAYQAGDDIPAPIVFAGDGSADDALWLADGFHRIEALLLNGETHVMAIVRPGSLRDAILYSVAANAAHGLRRTPEDKERAVSILLSDSEWSGHSDRWIAQACRVSHGFVAKIREALHPNGQASETRTGLDGKEYTVTAPAQAPAEVETEPAEESASEPAGEPQAEDDKPERPAPADKPVLDETDEPIPPGLLPIFAKRADFKSILSQLDDIGKKLAELHAGPAGSPQNLQAEQIDIRNLKESVRFDMPYAVCPVCFGIAKTRKANCPCKDKGWLVKPAYKKLPQEWRK